MPWDELWSQLWRVDNLMQRGRLGDAANAVAQLGMFVDRINQPLARWHLERCRFAVALTLGDFSAARQAMESGDRYSRAAGDLAVSRRHLQHTLIAWLTGEECDEAIAAVESIARSRFRGLAAPWISGRLRLCNLALARGLRGEAERHYALLPAVGMDHVMPAMATVAAADRSVAAAELGHRQDCAILYKEMLPYADQFASSGAGAVACHGSMELFLGVCAVGLERHDVAMRHLEAAVERNDANGMRPWAAEGRWWLARALHSRRRAGDAGRALALIAESREAATALGMAPLVRQLDELEPGVRRGTQRGRLLTKREEEIARLIAQGLTSREVGETVHISARTADNHVQHILDKLNLRSRSQIGAWIKGGRG
jgi:DNA-binding CsgD family transcriptional regulator